MKKFFILTLILILTSCGFNDVKNTRIKIKNRVVIVEVVETPQAQAVGLSDRESLNENEGMLFVYSEKLVPTFWMKDMLFSIDIIWIADDEIVDLSEKLPVPYGGEITRVRSKKPVNYVLEVNAGFIDKNRVKIGDRVEIGIDKAK